MRRLVLVGVAALAPCASAMASDFGIPIDIFVERFNRRAADVHSPAMASLPFCPNRTACFADLGEAVSLLTSTGPDDDRVIKAEVVTAPTGAGGKRFAASCDALLALLSPGLTDIERQAVISGMIADARQHGRASSAPRGRARYDLVLRDDHRLLFTAVP